MITDASAIDSQIHKNCVVCGSSNDRGLHVEFIPLADGGVQAFFQCGKAYEGYAGKIHGGVISALLDGAMTHCIFQQGDAGVTGELKVRYRHPVEVGQTAIVRGWIKRDATPLYITEAELIQDGQVKATATAKFMAQPQLIERG
ncbi:MAG: PaaI family thioesterase [Phycisphaerales bacterium]|nr:PaaI family thioesterase [Phycisphaerales bacterium]